ncbi:hypothetical protein [Nonomuraea coxensis]|uniref:hypothetical protein n=1 Tax=Nonomuraea coxensis TaxID=404386 RepID=UPI00036834DD|nr:hypothetical protein [Nonomuraea coxensis]
MSDIETLVFDTGPLSHFAINNWLGVLKAVVGDRRALIPDVVVAELKVGAARDTRIAAALDASWVEQYELRSLDETKAYAHFARLLVRGERNRGEAGVLALAQTLDATAVVDDRAARKAAEDHGIQLSPTLALLCSSIRSGLLTAPLVAELADDLLSSEYHLPFRPGDFIAWAADNGLIPEDQPSNV